MLIQQVEVRTFITIFLLLLDIWASATFLIYLIFRRTVGFQNATVQLICWLLLYFAAQGVARAWAWYITSTFRNVDVLEALAFEFRYGVTLVASGASAVGIAGAVRLLTWERFGNWAWIGVVVAFVGAWLGTVLSL
jgi:hypothetical protein